MKKDFNTGLRKSIEADRVKLTRRRKLLLREMGLAEDLDSTELAEKLYAQTLVVDVLNRNLVRKDEEIERLKAKIAELEGGAKPVAKTSANSSVPPSRNPIGVPHTQTQRKPSGRLVVIFWTQLKVRDIASARPVARPIIVRFWYFLLIIFSLFLRWRQPQVSKMLPAACHRVLEEVSADWRASYICRAV